MTKKRGEGDSEETRKKRHKKRREERRREGERLRKEERELKRWRGHPWSSPLYAFCGELPVPGVAPEDLGMSSMGHPGGRKGTGRSATKGVPRGRLHARFQ